MRGRQVRCERSFHRVAIHRMGAGEQLIEALRTETQERRQSDRAPTQNRPPTQSQRQKLIVAGRPSVACASGFAETAHNVTAKAARLGYPPAASHARIDSALSSVSRVEKLLLETIASVGSARVAAAGARAQPVNIAEEVHAGPIGQCWSAWHTRRGSVVAAADADVDQVGDAAPPVAPIHVPERTSSRRSVIAALVRATAADGCRRAGASRRAAAQRRVQGGTILGRIDRSPRIIPPGADHSSSTAKRLQAPPGPRPKALPRKSR